MQSRKAVCVGRPKASTVEMADAVTCPESVSTVTAFSRVPKAFRTFVSFCPVVCTDTAVSLPRAVKALPLSPAISYVEALLPKGVADARSKPLVRPPVQ